MISHGYEFLLSYKCDIKQIINVSEDKCLTLTANDNTRICYSQSLMFNALGAQPGLSIYAIMSISYINIS